MQGNLIYSLKRNIGYSKGDISKISRVSNQDRIRSNEFKLDKDRFEKKIYVREKIFQSRVVDDWNGLGNQIIGTESIRSIYSGTGIEVDVGRHVSYSECHL